MQIEATGKSVELAIQNGLLECGMKREDVNVKIVEQGGLFKKAKVVLSWGEDVSEAPTQDKEETPVEPMEVVENNTTEQKAEPTLEKKVETKKVVDTSRLENRCKEFLLGLAKFLDENATVDVEKRDNEITFAIHGNNLSKLIGFHGDNIQAVQMLLSGLKAKGEGAVRLYVDIDGYKANKNQSIIDLANRVAEQAIKIERNIHLDPMNAYERRIIHTTLQDRPDVTTESTGEGEKRHVVIKPTFRK